MSLNKRTGLYALPSHHLHGANPVPRPTFNSMDFAVGEVELRGGGGGLVKLGDRDVDGWALREEKDKKRKKRKEKKKGSRTVQGAKQVDGCAEVASTTLVEVRPATAGSEGKDAGQGNGASLSGRKRKRKSEQGGKTPLTTRKSLGSGGFVVGASMLQDVRTSVKAAGDVFTARNATAAAPDQPAKKRKAGPSRKSNDTVDFDRMAEETRVIDNKAKKEKRKEKSRGASATPARLPAAARTSVPLPVVFSSPPKNTPVPLPANAFSDAVNARKADRVGRRDSRLLVVETPPSQVPKTPVNLPDSPIPFHLAGAAKTTGRKKAKNEVEVSPPTPVVDEAPSSAPPVLNKHQRLEFRPDGRVSLTTSNLMRYTQPLNDEARPRPLSRAASVAASTAGSTTSGGTTPSIKELFARVGKPYSRSGAEIDPFVVAEVKKKVTRESHDEADVKAFTERYRAVQKAVNFSDEIEYLDEAVSWRTGNEALGPLPCLGIKASGCNSKREQVLRLSKEDASNEPKVLVTTEADQAALEAAKQRSAEAEAFLAHAVAARVPVPIGRLEGVWKLFCPPYSDSHVDKYGYGQRTLTIFSIAGFQDAHAYTARLSIPPRSMLYSILSFSAPPHASFRATTVRTAAEGYGMDLVFLGNGYLQLRVDVGLLLSGKPTETKEGRHVVMEFVGVHESAVVWREEKDELEEEGRKLFAKYDGD